jgi:hypothetical protein
MEAIICASSRDSRGPVIGFQTSTPRRFVTSASTENNPAPKISTIKDAKRKGVGIGDIKLSRIGES